jgi:hypothetical protein
MPPKECYDKIRFSLSDESGALRFERFEIANAPECWKVEQKLRAHLVGRALAKVDLSYLRSLTCDGDGACMRAVVQVIEEHQQLFLRTRGER